MKFGSLALWMGLIGTALWVPATYAATYTNEECRTQLAPKGADPSLIFVSDTQAPIWIERLWLKDDDNREATRRLFEAVAEERPDAVFHGGDLVAKGPSSSDWRKFWEAFAPVSRWEIPLFAAPGNHEFLFNAKKGRRNFERHFPSFTRCEWQTVEIGGIAVVLLNSNFREMDAAQIALQNSWLEAELARLDERPEIRSVVVLTHHAPFTNGRVAKDTPEVQEHFVPRYLASKKAGLMLTGHSHVYEHFREGGKDFMVIGGGGGLLHRLKKERDRRYLDLHPNPEGRGFFHYLKVELRGGKGWVTVMKYDPADGGFASDYLHELPW